MRVIRTPRPLNKATMSTDFVLHQFRPTETIDAVMRLKGRHNYTPEELVILRKRFNELNGLVVPRPGDTFKIPLMEPK